MFKLFLIFLICAPLSLHAVQYYIDPGIGHVEGTFHQDLSGLSGTRNGTTVSGDTSVLGILTGTEFGMKVYAKGLEYLTAGVDINLRSLSLEPISFAGTGRTYEGSAKSLGVFFGLDFSSRWIPSPSFSYYLVNDLDVTYMGEEDQYKGSGYRIGFMFGVKLKIHFDFTESNYTERDGIKLPATVNFEGISGQEQKLETSEFALRLSYPFEI